MIHRPAAPIAPPERDFRGPGCDERCAVVKAMLAGALGRSELLLHDPAPHEEFGRRLASLPSGDAPAVVRTGPLTVDLAAATACISGSPIHLAPVERRLLFLLAKRPGVLIWYDAVVAAVWGMEGLSVVRGSWLHALRVAVSRLRGKLGPAAPLLVAVHTAGLRLDIAEPCDTAPAGGYARPARLAGRWSVRWDACRVCGRTEFPHGARGLCSSCRAKERTAERQGQPWSREWDACRDCGRSDRRYYGRGYCETCFRRLRRQGAL